MKKIIVAGIILTSAFSLSLEERVQILEQKVKVLEQKLNIVDKSQNKIKKQIDEGLIKTCNKLKLVKYSYEYNDAVLTKSYTFKYKLKNNYSKPIKYVFAGVGYYDSDNVKMVEDYIKKDVKILPNKTNTVKTNYLVTDGDLAEYLKDTPKKELKVEFHPFTIIFEDGQKIKCN